MKSDLRMDIKEAKKSHIDNILKYFLYLVLDEKHEKKATLDVLQPKIEALQHKRLHPQSESPVNETDGQEDEHSIATPEVSKQTDEEINLLQERDKILQGLFDDCLNSILIHANSPEIRNLLRE